MRVLYWLTGLLVACAPTASYAQAAVLAPARLEFDVASIRENKTGMPQTGGERPRSNFPLGPGSMYSPNGGVFSAINEPLDIYILFAYKLTDHEMGTLRKQMPKWALEAQYDIEAKTDKHDATKDEMRLMMQSLLAERFKLTLHRSKEEASVFALVLVKPGRLGPGLRPHPADDATCSNLPPAIPGPDAAPTPKPAATVAGGFPVICGGAAIVPPKVPGRLAFGYRNVSMALIASQMGGPGALDRPVVDRTGLKGSYDFLLEFSPELLPGMTPPPGSDATGPNFLEALTEQTGLKLVPEKALVDTIVLDRIEHPSAN